MSEFPPGQAVPPPLPPPPPPAPTPPPAPAAWQQVAAVPPPGWQPPPAAPVPRRRPPWLVPVVIGGSAVVLVIAAIAIAAAVLTSSFSPQAQAERFLTALVDGRASDAVALLDAAPDGATIIDDAGYAAATDRISGFSIERSATDGSAATVSAIVQQAGTSAPVELALVQDGRTGPLDLFPLWRVDAAILPVISVEFDAPDGITIAANDRQIDGAVVAGATAVTVLPGTWAFGAGEEHELLTFSTASTTVGFGESVAVEIGTELSDAGVAAARAAVDAYVAACASGTDYAPPAGCGMLWEATPGETYSNPRWSLEISPTYDLDPWLGGGVDVASLSPAGYRLDADVVTATQYGTVWWTWDIDLLGTVWLRDGAMVFESRYD